MFISLRLLSCPFLPRVSFLLSPQWASSTFDQGNEKGTSHVLVIDPLNMHDWLFFALLLCVWEGNGVVEASKGGEH